MSDDGTVPWRALLAEATAALRAAGVDDPAREARWLVEEASGCSPSELLTVLDAPATVRGVGHLDAMVARRGAGEPLQYVLGHWPFRQLDLFVDGRVLIPRPETEQVVELALSELARRAAELGARGVRRRLRCVDLGVGSGAIAISLAVERADTEVVGVDNSADALAVATANLAGIGRAATRVSLVQGSWFDALDGSLVAGVDLVVSNPPYVAASAELPDEVAAWEPHGALVAGPTGLEALEAIVRGVAPWLAPGGAVVIELSPEQALDAVDLAEAAGLVGARIGVDLAGVDRALIARSR